MYDFLQNHAILLRHYLSKCHLERKTGHFIIMHLWISELIPYAIYIIVILRADYVKSSSKSFLYNYLQLYIIILLDYQIYIYIREGVDLYF